eukprot:CAMPEP_0182868090 /NCGR_PEP_ID=MMETSP0034_2-20130328/9110_1 /TAXON_ID=156128 /ORGANISM="Nephroselmis pyriformis, Strain CCMP717" /LENGTH=141 /DNA_ID=CAMNT_0025000479 /DNA_START=32 /DNA_END=454 /DNA_ORIENTATION=+
MSLRASAPICQSARCQSGVSASCSSSSSSIVGVRLSQPPRAACLRASRSAAGVSIRSGPMKPDEPNTETERSPLDFPQEWMKPNPSRRPDVFPEFKPIDPVPEFRPMPGDPEVPDDEEKEEEEKDPDNPDEEGEEEEKKEK